MPAPLFSFPLGTDRTPNFQVTLDGVTPSTAFQSSDTLSASVWVGEDQPVLFNPTAAWLDATSATFSVSFAAAQTSALDPQQYYLRVTAARAGQTVVILDCPFGLDPSPGTATPLASYCSYRDMLKFAPWLAKLQSQSDLAGFTQERNDAKLWFDDLLHRHWRGGQGVSPDYYFLPGIAFSSTNWNRYLTVYRSGVRSVALQTWLDTGGPSNGPGLMITSEVIKANACYAIGQVAGHQVVPGKDNEYAAFARKFHALAEHTALSITAEIDTNNDGLTDTYVRLGVADTLEG